jgi:hypothetical protein
LGRAFTALHNLHYQKWKDGDVPLAWHSATRCGFPRFVQFVFPAVPMPPSPPLPPALEKNSSFTALLRGNTAITFSF